MTLIGAILRKVQSQDSAKGSYSSPPPEISLPKKKKRIRKFADVNLKVDSGPPQYCALPMLRKLKTSSTRLREIYAENVRLLMAIRKTQADGGRVDCRWAVLPPRTTQKYQNRVDFLHRIRLENRLLHRLITTTNPRVDPIKNLRHHWRQNRRAIIALSKRKFVLFPPVPQDVAEDAAFLPPPGVKRPRAYVSLRIKQCARIGELVIELFTEVCPLACQLFLELVDGDGVGYGYVGTHFFRKVPGLYWSGGDVTRDNGFGCYAQRGRLRPIGAENYHFSHSMPGLLSMRMTPDDEMCGIFNITFKPLPQFDLQNVVFARVIRPSTVYNSIRDIGSPLSYYPVVEICGSRRRVGSRWVFGTPNTKMVTDMSRFKVK